MLILYLNIPHFSFLTPSSVKIVVACTIAGIVTDGIPFLRKQLFIYIKGYQNIHIFWPSECATGNLL